MDLDGIFLIFSFNGASKVGDVGCGVSLHIDPTIGYQLFWYGGNEDSLTMIMWVQGHCSLDVPALCN